jgi:hypothetical protein
MVVPAGATLGADRLVSVLIGIAVTIGAVVSGFVAGDEPIVAVIAAGGALAAFACLARPNVATYLVVAILYSNAAAIATQLHGVPYFFAAAFPLALVLPLAFYLVARRERVVLTSAMPFLIGYALVQLVGTILAEDIDVAWAAMSLFLTNGLALFIGFVNSVRSIEVLRRIVMCLVLIGAALGSLTVIQAVTGDYNESFGGFAQVDEDDNIAALDPDRVGADAQQRAAGPIGEENRYAQIMLVLVPLGLMLTLIERRRVVRIALALGTTLIFLGMAATFSRGAALGLALILAVSVVLKLVRLRHLAIGILAFVVVLTAFPRYADRLTGLQALTRLDAGSATGVTTGDVGNLRARATEMVAGILIFLDHPLVGVGPGMYPINYREYALRIDVGALDVRVDPKQREAHSIYTELAAETGGLGFFCFLAMIGITLRDLLRARKRWLTRRPDIAALATGFLLALTGYMGAAVFLHLSFERFFWLPMALAAVTAHLALTRVEGEEAASAGQESRRSGPRAVSS